MAHHSCLCLRNLAHLALLNCFNLLLLFCTMSNLPLLKSMIRGNTALHYHSSPKPLKTSLREAKISFNKFWVRTWPFFLERYIIYCLFVITCQPKIKTPSINPNITKWPFCRHNKHISHGEWRISSMVESLFSNLKT